MSTLKALQKLFLRSALPAEKLNIINPPPLQRMVVALEVKNADSAMYKAKQSDDGFCFGTAMLRAGSPPCIGLTALDKAQRGLRYPSGDVIRPTANYGGPAAELHL